MSQDEARAFLKKLMKNEELYEELGDRHELDASEEPTEQMVREEMARVVPGMAAEHGYDFTEEEGFEALNELVEEMNNEELSDDELEKVAGGKSPGGKMAFSLGTLGIGCAANSTQEKEGDPKQDWCVDL